MEENPENQLQIEAAPILEFAFEIHCRLAPPIEIGDTPAGRRRVIPILEGSVEGPAVRGVLLPGGADWQTIRTDGVVELQAHYVIAMEDGALVQVRNRGLRHGARNLAQRIEAGEQVDPSEYYCRTSPVFEAPVGKYEWLNRNIFLATAQRTAASIKIIVYRVQ